MKKSEILKKIKGEILGRKEAKQITGGYDNWSVPSCPSGKMYPPHGSWINGQYLYYDSDLNSWCKPNY
ncbi:hypothetical protein [uncultured Aquimarina sp.]|uniref:hypothetical protein n=1 Tax=uncultured Aquimarina sp. TaxID=575652 RepID=UPI002638393C|nr:hypothetical protein [uncultured Aquimarina sp.]